MAWTLFWRDHSTPECQCVCYMQLNKKTRFLHTVELGGLAIIIINKESGLLYPGYIRRQVGLGHLGKEQSLWGAVFSGKYLRGKGSGVHNFLHYQ